MHYALDTANGTGRTARLATKKPFSASPGDTESFAFTGRSLDLLLNDRYCTIGIVHHFKTVAILGGPACLHEHASN